ncbi:MAG: RimK/LysX family protein [Candidatus Woesearchaeota archaeon]
MNEKKEIIGMVEEVKISNLSNEESISDLARIDTGAAKSSIDLKLAAKLKLGPIIEHSKVRNSHGNTIRPVIEAKIEIGKKIIIEKFNIVDRSKMKYNILVGRNVLKNGFLIDATREDK